MVDQTKVDGSQWPHCMLDMPTALGYLFGQAEAYEAAGVPKRVHISQEVYDRIINVTVDGSSKKKFYIHDRGGV